MYDEGLVCHHWHFPKVNTLRVAGKQTSFLLLLRKFYNEIKVKEITKEEKKDL